MKKSRIIKLCEKQRKWQKKTVTLPSKLKEVYADAVPDQPGILKRMLFRIKEFLSNLSKTSKQSNKNHKKGN